MEKIIADTKLNNDWCDKKTSNYHHEKELPQDYRNSKDTKRITEWMRARGINVSNCLHGSDVCMHMAHEGVTYVRT